MKHVTVRKMNADFEARARNRPFPNSPQPPFQSEAKCEVCHENQFSFSLKLELLIITKISHLDSLRKRGWGELRNGLLNSLAMF